VTAALDALPHAPGVASGASNTARQTGGALGVAIFSALAGSSTAAGFSGRTAAVLVGSAVAFLLAAAGALARGRGPGERPTSPNSPTDCWQMPDPAPPGLASPSGCAACPTVGRARQRARAEMPATIDRAPS